MSPETWIDWSRLGSLRLRAHAVADGIYAGTHRSIRRGSGVEFGGHRDYVAGDDLRWLDHRAMMRHGKLFVRLFETETDRTVSLIVDASRSMEFRSDRGPLTKFDYTSVLAAALARIAVGAGDPVSLDFIGGRSALGLPTLGGKEAFERVVSALEACRTGDEAPMTLEGIERGLAPVVRRARRGSVIVFFSDLIDLPAAAESALAALCTHNRAVVVVQTLDPTEANFPFEGPVRLKALEGPIVVETDATAARTAYLHELDRLRRRWRDALMPHGGQLVACVTSDDPVEVVRGVLQAAARGAR